MNELLPGNYISSEVPLAHASITGIHAGATFFGSSDAVPFRLTPNMQQFIGNILTEGILTSAMMAIGRGLTEREVFALS